MGAIARIFVVSIVTTLVFVSAYANAAEAPQNAAPVRRVSASPLANVGSRLDTPLTPTRSHAGTPSTLPWHALDETTYERAKADAARRAASGLKSYGNDFAITATPTTQSVVRGNGVTYSVTTQVSSGTPKTVSLSVNGLPSGASGTFAPSSILAGQSSTLTVRTTASTPTGSFTLTIAGTYKSPPTTHSTVVTLMVTAPVGNDFAISAAPSSQSVTQGSSAAYTVSTQVSSGSAQTVSLSVSGVPSGASAAFAPASVTAGASSTLTIGTTSTTAAGTFTLTITGMSSSATHSTTVGLTVSVVVADDFTITVTPSSQSVAQGASTTYAVATQVTSGSAQSITLSVAGVPAGGTASFNPATITAGASSTLTIATTSGTTTGSFTLTITGAGTSATHAAAVALTVSAAPSGPRVGPSWKGQAENDLAPPDPTGAIGPSSYIELINLRYGIYGRDGSLVNEGDLGALTLFPVSELSDPQIVWDPYSQRFYYLVLDFNNSAYAFGYSKSAAPQSATDFCHYYVGAFYSNLYLPDYPKMAVTQDFVLVGTNVFLLASLYNGSDVDWFQKPTDPTCPSQLGAGGVFSALKNADGSLTSTPEPAVSADTTSGGWIVGSADVGTGSASFLTLFKVSRNASGYATISAPTRLAVASYQMPANAPQKGATQVLDTMDTRLTHAVAGFDPRIGATAVWTAHTVFGGAGAEDRWYEIGTAGTPQVVQAGKVTDPTLYVWNGAVSPDRAADDATDATAVTGSNMVMGFNTSSANTYSALQIVSKRGADGQSGMVLVKQSLGPNIDFACGGGNSGNVCRWGDYAGAVPDPLMSSGGEVWLSGEWNDPATDGSTPTWQTWNWAAFP